ncbi:MAG: CDP-alcohol phosphatidyltransferase family protein [Promethearchaeota archaeon]
MVLNNYRGKLQFFLDGPANFLIKLRIGPNMTSFIGFFFTLLGSVFLAFPTIFLRGYTIIIDPGWYFWWGWVPLLSFGIGSYFDALDGTVARKTDKISKFGGFLDSTLDRFSDATIILGLILGNMIWPWGNSSSINDLIGFAALSIVLLISYTRSRAELEGVEMKGVGFMERAERVLLIIIAYLIDWIVFCIQEQYGGGWHTKWIFPAFFILFTLLCFETLIRRMWHTYKTLNEKKKFEFEQIV